MVYTLHKYIYVETGYISERLLSIFDTIPLTITIIKTTDIISKSQNYNISIVDLKVYVENIEKFRLMLLENGMDEYEFFQKIAIEIINGGTIKLKKESKQNKHIETQIKLVHDIFVSIIASELGVHLLTDIIHGSVSKFIELILLIIKYPPTLDQIGISDECKKQHRKNYKHVVKNQAFLGSAKPNDSFEAAIKNYYSLFSNVIFVKNLEKFEKYMKVHRNKEAIDIDYDASDSDDSSESESVQVKVDQTDGAATKEDLSDDSEINSLLQFFNETYE